MAKTYPDIGTFSPGDILTAATMNDVGTNLDNHRVPPICSVYRAAALSHTATGTYQTVAWDTELADTDGMWTASPNPTRITLNTAGIYLVTGRVSIANTTQVIAAGIYKDGGAYVYSTDRTGLSTLNYLSTSATIISTGSTYVEMIVYQASGGNLAYTTGEAQSGFSAVWLGQVA